MRRGKTGRAIAAAVIAILAVAGAWLGYIGAFGGALYTDIPAQSRTTQGQPALAAVIFSGDMGFRVGMGPRLGERLAKSGIPVTGVSSLVYFRERRTPTDVKHFIANAIQHALQVSHAKRIVLIGQSFGADMLHVGLTGLAPDLRHKVAFVTLVVPTDTVFYQISPAEMFELTTPDASALETASQLTWSPALCIQGVKEANSLCPLLRQSNLEMVALPGGHALNWDADTLFSTINTRLTRFRLL
jgi:type IV secretory pathway VirJ component